MIKVQQLVEALERAYSNCEEYLEENTCLSCPAETVCYPFTLDKIKNLKFNCDLDINDLLILREWCNENCHINKNLDLDCFCPACSSQSRRGKRKCIARWCRPINYPSLFGIDTYKEFTFNKTEAEQAINSSNSKVVLEFKNQDLYNDED